MTATVIDSAGDVVAIDEMGSLSDHLPLVVDVVLPSGDRP
jgi:hypothetical protein